MAESTIKNLKDTIVEERVTLTSNASGYITIPQKDGYVVTSVIALGGNSAIWAYARGNALALSTNLSGTPLANDSGFFTIVYTRI